MRTNEPDMNIVNQINAALADVRRELIELSDFGKTPDISHQIRAECKAKYQLDLAITMIHEHRRGIRSQPWSERRSIMDEEFGEQKP